METRPPTIDQHHVIHHYREIASDIFALDLDDQTLQCWLELLNLTRQIDDAIDNPSYTISPVSSHQLFQQFLTPEYLRENFPHLSPDADPHRYEAMCSHAMQIFELNHTIKQTTSASEYIQHRQHEGIVFADIMLLACSDTVRASAKYGEFARNFRLMGESGILFDSIIDAHKDYKNGEIAVELSWQDKWLMTKKAARLTKEMSPVIFRPRALKALGRSGLRVIRDRWMGKYPIERD